MDRCLLTKRPLRFAFSPLTRPWLSAPAPRSARMAASASSEDFGSLQWKPALRMEESELMADAPSLLRTCADFDWKAQACELRSLAELSVRSTLVINQRPSTKLPGKDDGGSSSRKGHGGSFFAAGIAIATAAFSQSAFHLHALAAEEAPQQTEAAAAAAARAPAWLTPAFLAFPVVSYVIFYAYRSQVNPNAKVSDWMFGVAATVIIANLVLISTLGVRLY